MKPVQSVQSLMNKARVEKPWTGCFCVPLEWHALACTRPCRPRLQLAACTVRPPHPALVYCGTRPLLQVPQHLFRLGVCEKKKQKTKKRIVQLGETPARCAWLCCPRDSLGTEAPKCCSLLRTVSVLRRCSHLHPVSQALGAYLADVYSPSIVCMILGTSLSTPMLVPVIKNQFSYCRFEGRPIGYVRVHHVLSLRVLSLLARKNMTSVGPTVAGVKPTRAAQRLVRAACVDSVWHGRLGAGRQISLKHSRSSRSETTDAASSLRVAVCRSIS